MLLDIWMPDTDGITLLKEWAGSGQLTMPVVMMSGHGTIDTAVEATRIGAYRFSGKADRAAKAADHGGPRAETRRGAAQARRVARRAGPRAADRRSEAAPGAHRRHAHAGGAGGRAGCGIEMCARVLHARNTPWVDAGNHCATGRAADRTAWTRRATARCSCTMSATSRAPSKKACCCCWPRSRATTRAWCAARRARSPDVAAEGEFDATAV